MAASLRAERHSAGGVIESEKPLFEKNSERRLDETSFLKKHP